MVSCGFDAFYGNRRKRDVRAAVRFYREAAERGHPYGWTNLALCYLKGDGVPKSPKRAFECFVKAAELGHARAKLRVACCLLDGRGVKRDLRGGSELLHQLAHGDDDACYELAERRFKGIGLVKHAPYAVAWLRYGARTGFASCQVYLGAHLHNVVRTPRARREAVRWYRSAARSGLPHACANLFQSYRDGEGVPQNDRRALFWLKRAVELNEDPLCDEVNELAFVELAKRHITGDGVFRDRRRARRLLEKAVAEGSKRAAKLLATLRPRASSRR